MKKIIIIGFIAGLIMLAVGMFFGSIYQMVFPNVKNEFQNANLFRPWSDPIILLYFIHPFIVGIMFAWLWNKTKGLFIGKSAFRNGIVFGLLYWLFALPGMLISYASFPISLLMIINWSGSNLIQGLCAGILFSKTLK